MKNEQIKKGFNTFLKKLKKFLKKMWVAVKTLVIDAYKKFMELPKKVRYIIGIWLLVVIVLLVFIGGADSTNKFYAKYAAYEDAISKKALIYVNQNNIYATRDNKLVVDLEVLKEGNYVTGADIDDDTCAGISVIFYDDEKDDYVIDSYLNCKKYTTKNYWDYK